MSLYKQVSEELQGAAREFQYFSEDTAGNKKRVGQREINTNARFLTQNRTDSDKHRAAEKTVGLVNGMPNKDTTESYFENSVGVYDTIDDRKVYDRAYEEKPYATVYDMGAVKNRADVYARHGIVCENQSVDGMEFREEKYDFSSPDSHCNPTQLSLEPDLAIYDDTWQPTAKKDSLSTEKARLNIHERTMRTFIQRTLNSVDDNRRRLSEAQKASVDDLVDAGKSWIDRIAFSGESDSSITEVIDDEFSDLQTFQPVKKSEMPESEVIPTTIETTQDKLYRDAYDLKAALNQRYGVKEIDEAVSECRSKLCTNIDIKPGRDGKCAWTPSDKESVLSDYHELKNFERELQPSDPLSSRKFFKILEGERNSSTAKRYFDRLERDVNDLRHMARACYHTYSGGKHNLVHESPVTMDEWIDAKNNFVSKMREIRREIGFNYQFPGSDSASSGGTSRRRRKVRKSEENIPRLDTFLNRKIGLFGAGQTVRDSLPSLPSRR